MSDQVFSTILCLPMTRTWLMLQLKNRFKGWTFAKQSSLLNKTSCVKNYTKSTKTKPSQRILIHAKQQFVNLRTKQMDEFKARLCPNVVGHDLIQKCEIVWFAHAVPAAGDVLLVSEDEQIAHKLAKNHKRKKKFGFFLSDRPAKKEKFGCFLSDRPYELCSNDFLRSAKATKINVCHL